MNDSLVELTVEGLAFGGAGVARAADGVTVFVRGGYPGDVALARFGRRKKRWAEADAARIITPSPQRRQPVCPLAESCGGCPWMGFDYPAQLEWKRRIVRELFVRIGKLEVEPEPAAGGTQTGYRARVRMRVTGDEKGAQLAFRRAASNALVPVRSCAVASGAVNAAIAQVNGCLAARPGFAAGVEEIEIEASGHGGRVVVTPRGAGPSRGDMEALLAAGGAVRGGAVARDKGPALYGDPYLETSLGEGVALRHGPGAFTQVNPEQNLVLIRRAMDMARPTPGTTALDLYCGIGNFSFPLALAGMAVTGVDSSKAAAEDAVYNRGRLGVSLADFTREDAVHAAARFAARELAFDAVILDPPRGGAAELIADAAKLARQRIVYISCDPPALARDAAALNQLGFAPRRLALVDMFPHTAHIESVLLMERR